MMIQSVSVMFCLLRIKRSNPYCSTSLAAENNEMSCSLLNFYIPDLLPVTPPSQSLPIHGDTGSHIHNSHISRKQLKDTISSVWYQMDD